MTKGKQVHWTLKKLKKELEKEFGINIGTTPLWKHLKKMELVLKKPRPIHAEADRIAQDAFKKKLKIKAETFLNNIDHSIFFFDEGRFGLQSTVTRIWAKRGETVQVKVHQGYKNFYTYSCVSPHSGESFSLFLPEVNTEMMNIFLDEFSKKYSEKEILLIMDRAGWHKAKDLKVPHNTKLMLLPSYSPELNPVEKLWQWLRKEVTHNNLFKTLYALMDALEKEFRKLTPKKFAQLCHCPYL